MSVSKGFAESPGASSTSTSSSTLDKFVVTEAATDAEIRWYPKYVVSSYLFGSCDVLADLFRSMFPDSTIAEKFCLQKNKSAYFINYDICSTILFYTYGQWKGLWVLCNFIWRKTIIQMGQMDLVANFWDDVANKGVHSLSRFNCHRHARH